MLVRATPHNKASELALAIYGEVLSAVRADALVHKALERVGDALFVQGRHIDLGSFDRVWIAGSGKASVEMARAAAEVLGDKLSGGLVVAKGGSGRELGMVEVLEAAHPIPDDTSVAAGARMLQFAKSLTERDLVIYALSGGSSALMESPRGAIGLDDLQETNRILIGSGLDIRAINAVRSGMSRIKAGGLARAFQPATVIALVLSDVVGNDLQAIGSGPLIVPADSFSPTPRWLIEGLPKAVRETLEVTLPPLPISQPIEHVVIGGISLAIHAAAAAAQRLGLRALPYADPLKGEARSMAARICNYAKKQPAKHACLIFGGETTVTLRGQGLGGRCQEMALAAAGLITKMGNVCFLACGTDGADGPTDAAGGIVDPGSGTRAKAAGFTRVKSLAENDSYRFLNACDGLVFTGPTGSNVNDIVLFAMADP